MQNMRNLAKYALKYAANMQNMRHYLRIGDFENAIICGKICDMRIFAKYVNKCLPSS